MLVYDIETSPVPGINKLVRQRFPFDADSVKTGNLKDPEKIKAKIADAEQEHYQSKIDKAALDPKTGYVCAVGILNDEDGELEVPTIELKTAVDPKDEKELIQWLFDKLSLWPNEEKTFAGWNCHKFDLPFAVQRGWLNRLKMPPYLTYGRGFSPKYVDLMKQWCLNQYGEYAKLSEVAQFLGVAQPRDYEVDGKHFHEFLKMDKEQALMYLTDDLIETHMIAKVIL